MKLKEQLLQNFDLFGLDYFTYKHLDTPVNDVIEIATPTKRYALKLYNAQSRNNPEVQWELDLISHLNQKGAPVVKPVSGKHGYVETFHIDGQARAAALFEWAEGEKPQPTHDTYVLLGKTAARIHQAADSFPTPASPERTYDCAALIDEQLERMQSLLIAAGKWQEMKDLGARLAHILTNPALDWGICHMDLTLDNIHRSGDKLVVFDFDSAGACWRALEPYGVLKFSENYFKDWLKGYRTVRPFSTADEKAVAAFGIIGDLRVVAWKLGVAKSSRGKPLLDVSNLGSVVDEWLHWERIHLA